MKKLILHETPAFPTEEGARHHSFSGAVTSPGEIKGGLTKREWFAGLLLQGLLACDGWHGLPSEYANSAVMFTDALIEELNKEPQKK